MKDVLRLFGVLALAAVGLASCGAPPPPIETRPSVALIPLEQIPRDGRGRIKRSRSVIAAFQRQVPCPNVQARTPATDGGRRGACPGFEIDHIIPLCAGGPDAIGNLQWLWVVEHDEVKTPKDVAACAALRKAHRLPR